MPYTDIDHGCVEYRRIVTLSEPFLVREGRVLPRREKERDTQPIRVRCNFCHSLFDVHFLDVIANVVTPPYFRQQRMHCLLLATDPAGPPVFHAQSANEN